MSGTRELVIEVEEEEGVTIVKPAGEIDLGRSPALRVKLGEVIGRNSPRVIVDLSQVSYMDSSGVATLVEALQQCRAGNQTLVLCSMQPRVHSIFEIARLDMVFKIVESLEEARTC